LITLIVPTFNRAYALKQVLHTFYSQKSVSQIVFIDDCGHDETDEVVKSFDEQYEHVETTYHKNSENRGASFARNKGIELAKNHYVLFCDDDEFLGPEYAYRAMEIIKSGKADIVSGRHFYRLPGESFEDSLKRFGDGLNKLPIFDRKRFLINTDGHFEGEVELPFTHGIFMTTKPLLEKFGFDAHYSKGNGFREESDFQVNAFVNGCKIIMSNEMHCVHMHLSEVRTGGQRVSRIKRFKWNIVYTNYFFNKYYGQVSQKINLRFSKKAAIIIYTFAEFYRFFIRPFSLIPSKIIERIQS